MKKNIFYKIIAGLFLICLSIPGLNAMQDPDKTLSLSISPKGTTNQILANDEYAITDYPISTANLDDAFVTAIDLFKTSLDHISYMDKLLTEVKEIQNLSKKSAKYFEYFGRPAVLPGSIRELNYDTITDYINQIDEMHQKINKGLNQYLSNFENRLTQHRTIYPVQEFWTSEVDRIIHGLTLWIDGSDRSFKSSLDACERQIRTRLQRKSKNKDRRYTDILKEDHIIDFLTDQIDVWSKVRDVFRPYSSSPPKVILMEENSVEEKKVRDDELTKKRIKAAEKRKRQKQNKRLHNINKSLTVSSDEISTMTLQEKNNDLLNIIDGDRSLEDDILTRNIKKEEPSSSSLDKSPTTVSNDEIRTVILSQKNNTLEEVASHTESNQHLKDEVLINNTKKEEISVSKINEDLPVKKGKARKKKPNLTLIQRDFLSIKKNNYEVLESIFQRPIATDISINSFDNMIRSKSGFKGRVYGGKKSTIYEIYVTLNQLDMPKNFVDFYEYNQLKKRGEKVKKYNFTLHRPHLRGKNQKGHVDMYPALVEIASERLAGFNFTLSNIICG